MEKQMTQQEFDRAAAVPEVTPEFTPVKTDLSGGEQNNGPVPA